MIDMFINMPFTYNSSLVCVDIDMDVGLTGSM